RRRHTRSKRDWSSDVCSSDLDENNQFLYYNHHIPEDEMLASRNPGQVGNPLGAWHPDYTHKNVEWVIQQLRAGKIDTFRINVPRSEERRVGNERGSRCRLVVG